LKANKFCRKEKRMNRGFFSGRLTTDPIIDTTSTSFTIKTIPNPGDNHSIFVRCITTKDIAQLAGKYLTKNRLISVSGPIDVSVTTGLNGSTVATIEVIVQELDILDDKVTENITTNDVDLPF